MKTFEDFRTILDDCHFNSWQIQAFMDGDRPYLQVRAIDKCNVTGMAFPWGGRKWFLSPHMTKTEVVQTAFKAVMTAVEHETREQFKYRGESIFDPHLDVDAMWEFRRQTTLDAREAA